MCDKATHLFVMRILLDLLYISIGIMTQLDIYSQVYTSITQGKKLLLGVCYRTIDIERY